MNEHTTHVLLRQLNYARHSLERGEREAAEMSAQLAQIVGHNTDIANEIGALIETLHEAGVSTDPLVAKAVDA